MQKLFDFAVERHVIDLKKALPIILDGYLAAAAPWSRVQDIGGTDINITAFVEYQKIRQRLKQPIDFWGFNYSGNIDLSTLKNALSHNLERVKAQHGTYGIAHDACADYPFRRVGREITSAGFVLVWFLSPLPPTRKLIEREVNAFMCGRHRYQKTVKLCFGEG